LGEKGNVVSHSTEALDLSLSTVEQKSSLREIEMLLEEDGVSSKI